jgi:hypothetical protein
VKLKARKEKPAQRRVEVKSDKAAPFLKADFHRLWRVLAEIRARRSGDET